MKISDLRAELGLSLEEFAEKVGLASRGRMSVIERAGLCSFKVALAIESLSQGRIDAADLNEDVRAARHGIGNTPLPTPASPDNACEITPQGKAA